jgi:hypothetical protein
MNRTLLTTPYPTPLEFGKRMEPVLATLHYVPCTPTQLYLAATQPWHILTDLVTDRQLHNSLFRSVGFFLAPPPCMCRCRGVADSEMLPTIW